MSSTLADLQRLNIEKMAATDPPPSAPSTPDTTTLPVGSTTSSEAARPIINDIAQKESSIVAQTRRKPGAQKAKGPAAPKASLKPAAADPVRQAMLGMLALPYPEDMEEGAMTVTSVKIPKPIWERLEYARTLTKMDKQDIIADALRIYFELIVEGGLEK